MKCKKCNGTGKIMEKNFVFGCSLGNIREVLHEVLCYECCGTGKKIEEVSDEISRD